MPKQSKVEKVDFTEIFNRVKAQKNKPRAAVRQALSTEEQNKMGAAAYHQVDAFLGNWTDVIRDHGIGIVCDAMKQAVDYHAKNTKMLPEPTDGGPDGEIEDDGPPYGSGALSTEDESHIAGNPWPKPTGSTPQKTKPRKIVKDSDAKKSDTKKPDKKKPDTKKSDAKRTEAKKLKRTQAEASLSPHGRSVKRRQSQ